MKNGSIIRDAIGLREQQKLDEILSIIHVNYHVIPNVNALMKLVDVSDIECERLFRNYLKKTPMRYIREYRIKKVCELLINTDQSVTEISKQCGMGTSHLCQSVRKATGCSPLEYRRNYLREQNSNFFQKHKEKKFLFFV